MEAEKKKKKRKTPLQLKWLGGTPRGTRDGMQGGAFGVGATVRMGLFRPSAGSVWADL